MWDLSLSIPNHCPFYHDCSTYIINQTVCFPVPENEPALSIVTDVEESRKEQYCVVTYDNQPYPGIIHDVDDGEIEFMLMHRVGENRYFWPYRDDTL